MKPCVGEKSMFYGATPGTFELANRMRKHMTPAECILWAQLKKRNLFKEKFRRQHPAGRYILDFYCHEFRLAIELDGEIHDINGMHENDLRRTAELNGFGIKVIRFQNDMVFTEIDLVISTIKRELKQRSIEMHLSY